MANYTQHYQLHQWVPEDNFLRTDFNGDFEKIDAAIHKAQTAAEGAQSAAEAAQAAGEGAQSTADGKATIITGVYTGDDTASRTIHLGFQPKAVLVERRDAWRYDNATTAGLALQGKPCYTSSSDGGITITSTGFTVVRKDMTTTNEGGTTFYYLALR